MLLSIATSLVLLTTPPSDAAATETSYADELVARARSLELSKDTQWLKLVHYRPTLMGGYASEADGQGFFLSPEGATAPDKELEATLRAFFSDKAEHPQCQFPARFAWLHQKLAFDFTRLKARSCPKFLDFFQRVRAESATLVFSSYYLNNPASAFGHTFLRLNKPKDAFGTERQELLDHGVDYSATVDTSNALIYAVKGLFGLFKGHFNQYGYFYKVREYNDYESRDLWEYELALTPNEMALLVAHLWELGSTHFDYYYMTENCSYHVLGAVEVAAPRLKLLENTGKVVIPANTVKALYENPGLVRSVRYRPSVRTQFSHRVNELDAAQMNYLGALAADAEAPVPPSLPNDAAAAVFDAAVDFLDLKHAKDIVHGKDGEILKRRQRLLERRSDLRVKSPPLAVEPPWDKQPQLGHDSGKLSLGGGHARGTGSFATLDYRLSLHDLTDPVAGYPELSQIEFLPTRLRVDIDQRRVLLDDFGLVRVLSLTPVDRLYWPFSFRVRFGATTLRDRTCDTCLVGVAEVAGGFAFSTARQRFTVFAMGDSELVGGPRLAGIRNRPVRLGLGPFGGVRVRIGERLVALATGTWKYLPFTAARWTYGLGGQVRFHLGRNAAVGVDVKHTPTALEGSLQTSFYF